MIPLALILSGVIGSKRGLRNEDVHRYEQINIGLDNYNNPVILLQSGPVSLKILLTHSFVIINLNSFIRSLV